MALDVYVGSLTRYYAGDWENVAERAVRARGVQAGPRRRHPRGATARARESGPIQSAVLSWREALAASLGDSLPAPLDWDETPDAAYFTGRPDWDGFGALVLWAAYAEHPALRRPITLPEEWDEDPALVQCNAAGFRSRYSHLVRNVELWLPSPFEFTFEGEDVDRRRIVVGSAATLVRQLTDLNDATWKAADVEIADWEAEPAPDEAPLEPRARHAYAVLAGLARQAAGHRLPMKLDF